MVVFSHQIGQVPTHRYTLAVTWPYHPKAVLNVSNVTPSTPNPFRAIRLKLGISQYEVARRMGLSKHAVLRLEQGMYDDPLPTAVGYWLERDPKLSKVELLEDYAAFQIANRAANARFLGDFDFANCHISVHPLAYLRTRNPHVALTVTEVAKRLCLGQPVIFYFEKRPIIHKSVPAQLIRALHDADYTEDETQSLENAYAIHRLYLVKRQNLEVNPAVGTQSNADVTEAL